MDINNPKIKDLLDNEEKYIEELKAMQDRELERKLANVKLQMQMALEKKLFNEVDVLYLYQNMIISARVKRSEEGIEDNKIDIPNANGNGEDQKKLSRKRRKIIIEHTEVKEEKIEDKIEKIIIDEETVIKKRKVSSKSKPGQLELFGFDEGRDTYDKII